MIYKLNISEKNNLVTITAKGIYSLRDIKNLIHVIIDDPHYKITFNTLIDLRAIKYTPIVSEISVISSFIVSLKHYFKGKTAIVAEGELIYSMFKLSTLLLNKQGLKSSIFHNQEEALVWIKDPESITDPTSSQ